MEIHPVKFEDFDGRIHIEDEHVVIEELAGKIGHSVFSMDMNYYLGDDEEHRFMRRLAGEMVEWNRGTYCYTSRDKLAQSMMKEGLLECVD